MKNMNPGLNAKSTAKKSVKMFGVASLGAAVVFGSVSSLGLIAAQAAVDGPSVGLGTLESYSVLGGASVTNTGPTILNGDLGVSPGTSITGFPPGIINGVIHASDAPAIQAQSDLVTAYNDAAGRSSDGTVSGDLGGQTFVGGVYSAPSSLGLTGTVTLDGQNNPNSVFIFQVGSTLTTASSSNVNLVNGASACNVFWQVGSSATLGTASSFKGNILALTSITANTGATAEGRALARNGSVTLDTNTFTSPQCIPVTPPVTTEPTTPATTPPAVPPVTTEPTTPTGETSPTPPATSTSTSESAPAVPADSSTPLDVPPATSIDTTIPSDSSENLTRNPGDSSTPTIRTTDDSSLTLAKTSLPSTPNFLILISGILGFLGLSIVSYGALASRISRKH